MHARLRGPARHADNEGRRPRQPGPPVDAKEDEDARLYGNDECMGDSVTAGGSNFRAYTPQRRNLEPRGWMWARTASPLRHQTL